MSSHIDRDNFDSLLLWLHPDRERAGEKYESVRSRLIRIFSGRGVVAPEELADLTIDRVARKAGELSKTYSGDPALYFYGVAKNIFLEHSRRPRSEPLPTNLPAAVLPVDDGREEMQMCLDKCLRELSTSNFELITRYYHGDKQVKIRHRKNLTEELGISITAMRVRARRIRVGLERCVRTCGAGLQNVS